jgi:hypothetical protein
MLVCELLNQFANLATLDIHFKSLHSFKEFANHLAWSDTCESSLRNLQLSIRNTFQASKIIKEVVLQRPPKYRARLANVRKLTLDGFDLGELFSQIALVVRVNSITDLTL